LPFYRVRLGPFADRAQAQLVQADLEAQGSPQAAIVTDG
jgi:cell division protein FtsN